MTTKTSSLPNGVCTISLTKIKSYGAAKANLAFMDKPVATFTTLTLIPATS